MVSKNLPQLNCQKFRGSVSEKSKRPLFAKPGSSAPFA